MRPQATDGDRPAGRNPAASRAADAEGAPAEGKLDRWVCLDVGETLIDETRVWSTWADVLGVTPFTFMAAMGVVISRGEDHRTVFDNLDHPQWLDLRPEFTARYGGFRREDLYPDALPALDALRGAGYRVAIVANQPIDRTDELRQLGIDADVIAMSDELGAHKPDPAFYAKALELMGARPEEVAYVGDRLDNDIRPALAAGLRAVWLIRGPWAILTQDKPPPGALEFRDLTQMAEEIDSWWPR